MSSSAGIPARPAVDRLARDRDRDRARHRPQVADRRVDRRRSRAARRLTAAASVRAASRNIRSVIGGASAAIAPSPRPGKTKTLLAWPIACRPSVDLDVVERRAGRDDRAAVGPAQDVDRGRLGAPRSGSRAAARSAARPRPPTARMTASSNVPPTPVVPTRTVGRTRSIGLDAAPGTRS